MTSFDPLALVQLCDAFLQKFERQLRRRYPTVAPDLIQDAIHDALIQHVKQPDRFDPSRSSLSTYLFRAARSDLLNALTKESRRNCKHVPLVEETLSDGNNCWDRSPLEELIHCEEMQAVQNQLQAVQQQCTALERAALDLLVVGERSTAAYAQALQIQHLPLSEQERAVKRVKDRLKKRLIRGSSTV